jgi:hypothetical protein
MNSLDVVQLRRVIERTLSELGMPDAHWSCVTKAAGEEGQTGVQWPGSGVLAVLLRDQSAVEFRSENGDRLATVALDDSSAERELLAFADP